MATETHPKTESPPRRRRWRRAIVVVLFVLGVPLAIYFYFLWSFDKELRDAIAEADRLDPGWQLAELEAKRRPVDAAKNSGPLIRKVAAAVGTPGLETYKWDKLFEPEASAAQLSDQQFKYVTMKLGPHAKAILEARKLKDYPEGRFDVQWPPVTLFVDMQHCIDAMEVASLLHYDAFLRLHAEDSDGALESCLALLQSSRALGDEVVPIANMIRCHVQRKLVLCLERVLAQSDVSPAALELWQELLGRELGQPLLLQTQRGMRALGHLSFQDLAAGKIKGRDLGLVRTLPNKLSDQFPGYAARHHGTFLQIWNEEVEIAKLPEEQQHARFEKTKRRMDGFHDQALVKIMAADFRIDQIHWRSQALLRSAQAGLAAERYRLKQGHWPANLQALVDAGLLDKAPRDPFDGAPLRWLRVTDGLIIYSIGPNLRDDGGILHRGGPALPVADAGFRLWDPPARRQAPPLPVPGFTVEGEEGETPN